VKFAIIALVFGVINGLLRPIVQFLSLPLKLVTFGVLGFIINTGLVILTALISDRFDLGFRLAGWPPGEITLSTLVAALLVALVVSVVATLVALLRKVVPGP
jgi:putative membrane protein